MLQADELVDFGFASVTRTFQATALLPHGPASLCSSAVRLVHCAGSELVVLVFEEDVERGERAVTARDALTFLISDLRFPISET